jgi:hypothetical protein
MGGTWQHRILSIEDGKSGVCSKCGKVSVSMKDGRLKCDIARALQNKNRDKEKLRLYNLQYVKRESVKRYRSTVGYMFIRARSQARGRGLDFTITKADFIRLRNQECFYCGKKSSKNGIDRKDSKKGYLIDNCVSSCRQCNTAKMALSVEDFIKLCKAIAERF